MTLVQACLLVLAGLGASASSCSGSLGCSPPPSGVAVRTGDLVGVVYAFGGKI